MKRLSKFAMEIGFIIIMAVILKSAFSGIAGTIFNMIASLVISQ